jgi:DNA/RNA endonuclease YhcR with UshA esterase domain
MILSIAALPALAHHSFAAAYDMSKPITVQGTIAQVRLTNPHSWFFIDVKAADGKLTRWAFEAGTPSGMIRNGYKTDEIKSGAVVTIRGFHAKDPSQNAGMLDQLTTAEGKTYTRFGPQEGPGAQ